MHKSLAMMKYKCDIFYIILEFCINTSFNKFIFLAKKTI